MNNKNTYGSHDTEENCNLAISDEELQFIERYFDSDEHKRCISYLRWAISTNDLKEVQQCIKNGVDLSGKNATEALWIAFENENAQIVKELLNASGIDVLSLNCEDENRTKYPLYVEAAIRDNYELMKSVFPIDQYVSNTDDDFCFFKRLHLHSALVSSFRNMNFNCIKFLLENDADIDRYRLGVFCQILSKKEVTCNLRQTRKAIKILELLIDRKSKSWLCDHFVGRYGPHQGQEEIV
jgi:hypothetical protein